MCECVRKSLLFLKGDPHLHPKLGCFEFAAALKEGSFWDLNGLFPAGGLVTTLSGRDALHFPDSSHRILDRVGRKQRADSMASQ